MNWNVSSSPQTEGHPTDFLLKIEGDTISLSPAEGPEFKFIYKRVPETPVAEAEPVSSN